VPRGPGPATLSLGPLTEPSAVRLGHWHRFADLVLERDPVDETDALVSFDPITNVLPVSRPTTGCDDYGSRSATPGGGRSVPTPGVTGLRLPQECPMPTSPPSRLPYRPALDGVRALAVLAVVAFHFGASWLPGGLIGVDVFFALSGFLITSLLLREHRDTGRIDVLAFWGRRARRLLPALLLLLVVIAGWAAWVASPSSVTSLRADALAALLYVANWRFVTSGAAYTATTEQSMLLHTWSLGVEEQWYLLVPLLLLGLLRWARRPARLLGWVLVVIAVASASLMSLLWASGAGVERVYYGTDTRLFTLVSGALLALVVERRGLPSARLADLAGLTGTATLVLVAARVGPLNPWLFSGGLVLVALAASALVLAAATPGSWTSWVLSWRPLVVLGILSYGVYLWHWPVVVALPTWPWLSWAALTVAAAGVSFVLVERPVRTASWSGLPRRLRATVPAVAMVVVAVTLLAATPAPPRGSSDAEARTSDVPPPLQGELGSRVRVEGPDVVDPPVPARPRKVGPPPNDGPLARLRPVSGPLDVAVLGDSVAFSLTWHAPADTLGLRAYGEHVLGCGLTDQPLAYPGGGVLDRPHCVGFVESWPASMQEQPPDAALLVAGAWELHDLRVGDRVLRVGTPAHDTVLRERWRLALGIATSGGRPAVVTDVPCFDVRQPGDPRSEALRIFHLNQLLAPLVEEHPTARLAPLSRRLCPDGRGVGGRAARYDGVHFTASGASDLWPWLNRHLRLAVAQARQRR
jgi:peptidoglycan/LPS O-acetylase OafA/YrhL